MRIMRTLVPVVLVAALMASSGIALAGTDIEGHWAAGQISTWVENGLINGYPDGTFRPDNTITRAEFLALVNRAFKFRTTATVTAGDVKPSDWFAADVGKATAARYVLGYSDGTFKPGNTITRQEAAVILSRLLNLNTMENRARAGAFLDANMIPDWSAGAIGAILAEGYMAGYPDGTFQPAKAITRAEAIAALDRAFGAQYAKAGEYGPAEGVLSLGGNALVSVPGVTLRNMEIAGDLIIAEGVGEGAVTLRSVTVKGNTTIRGGGVNSIIIIDSELGTVTIQHDDGPVRVVVTGNSAVAQVNLVTGATLDASANTGTGVITVTIPAGIEVNLAGYFNTVNVETAATVNLTEGAITNLVVAGTAAGATVNLNSGTTVTNLTLNSPCTVSGEGAITTATVNSDGVIIEKRPSNVAVASGVTVTVAGDTLTESTSSGRSSSGGGSGGGGAPDPDVKLTGLAENLAADFIPAFDGGTYAYTLAATNAEASVEISPTLVDATITWNVDTDGIVDPTGVASGSAATIPLVVGENVITLRVEKAGTTAKDYVITVTRAAPPAPDVKLTGLAENLAADFVPVFDGGTYAYTLAATNAEVSVEITPTLADATITWNVDTDLAPDPTTVASGSAATIPLVVGENVITLRVEKAGATAKDYVITVTRAAPPPDVTPPTYDSVGITGADTVRLTFSEPVWTSGDLVNNTDITVTVGGVVRAATTVAAMPKGSASATMDVTFGGEAAKAGDAAEVGVTATGATKIRDASISENAMAGAQSRTSDVYAGDHMAPTYDSVAIIGSNTVRLTFSEPVWTTGDMDDTSDITVTVEGVARTATTVGTIAKKNASASIDVTFDGDAAEDGDTAVVGVTAAGAAKIKGASEFENAMAGAQSHTSAAYAADVAPPTYDSVAFTEGRQVTLTFSEPVWTTDSLVDTVDIIVTVEGVARAVTTVEKVEKGNASTTIDVAFGGLWAADGSKTAVVTITGDGAAKIKDAAVNENAMAGGQARTAPARDLAPPVWEGNWVEMDTAILYVEYDELLDEGSVPAPGDFCICGDDAGGRTVIAVSVDDRTVILTLSSPVPLDADLFLCYTKGENPIRDLAGNDAYLPRPPADGGDLVDVLDRTPPVLLSATVESGVPGRIKVVYNELLRDDLWLNPPDSSDFQLGGEDAGENRVIDVYVSGDTVYLDLATALAAGDVITISYTPGTKPIMDAHENAAESFSDWPVTNNVE